MASLEFVPIRRPDGTVVLIAAVRGRLARLRRLLKL
jgi:hypothetical protein